MKQTTLPRPALPLSATLAARYALTAAVERPAKQLIEAGHDLLYPGQVRNDLRNINDFFSLEKSR